MHTCRLKAPVTLVASRQAAVMAAMSALVKAKPATLCCQPGGLPDLSASAAQGLVSAGSGPGMNAIVRFLLPRACNSRFRIDPKEPRMTSRAAFSPEEWKVVLEGPPSAGMIVVTAARGGMIRESIAMSKAYVEARAQHGESELLDEIVAAKPETDHTRYHSAAELRENGLKHLRDAVALLETKATAGELDDYRRFVSPSRARSRQRTRRRGRL